MRGRAAAKIAPGRVFANRHQNAPKGWRWGPKYDGGDWIVQDTYGRPWAFRVGPSDTTPEIVASEFGRMLDDYIWELEHPALIASMVEAEPSTRAYPTPEQETSVPSAIIADVVELNDLARRKLDRKGSKPTD